MHLHYLKFKDHPILKNLYLNFINPKTKNPFSIVAFVGENGCGKTSILNEISKYDSSEYIIDKEEFYSLAGKRGLAYLFLRQGLAYYDAINNGMSMINGTKPFPSKNNDFKGGNNVGNLRSNNNANNRVKGLEILEELGDERITELFKNNRISDVFCGKELTAIIGGQTSNFDSNEYSSGQIEFLLKIRDLQKMGTFTDCILIDEPEASLHPRWQLKAIELIKELARDSQNNVPQLFIATHSEKILQSLLENDDVLIIRLKRKNEEIVAEPISKLSLRLPKPSFAELDFLIFNIDNFEYVSQLVDLIEWKLNVKGNRGVDKHILGSKYYKAEIHNKEWVDDRTGGILTKTLPLYVRNYFHHPKDREKPTNLDVHRSIVLLRQVTRNLKEKE